ncbi:hypothetical protein QBC45DRAFT_15210 [Copromyces sp. CBS 386.78]|nr:hypothetical protein QBC45DRAFT_15210 [Copromyces sp. CBS 386.78]
MPPCPTVDGKAEACIAETVHKTTLSPWETSDRTADSPETQPSHDPFWTTAIMICPKWDSQRNWFNCLKLHAFTSQWQTCRSVQCAVCSYPPCLVTMARIHSAAVLSCGHPPSPSLPTTPDDTLGQGRAVSTILTIDQTSYGARTTRNARSRPLRSGGRVLSSVYIGAQLVTMPVSSRQIPDPPTVLHASTTVISQTTGPFHYILHTDLHTHKAIHLACLYRQRGSWWLSKNSSKLQMTLPWSLALWNCGERYCGE